MSTSATANTRGFSLARPRGRRAVTNTVMRGLTYLAGVLAILPLVWILGTVIVKGAPLLFTAQPDYTMTCVDAAKVRVTTDKCGTTFEAPAPYKWAYRAGGSHVAVGEKVASGATTTMPKSRNGDPLTFGRPTGDGAGVVRMPSASWWTNDLGSTSDRTPNGGVLHAIYGTVLIGLICAAIAVPLGILGAIYLVEYARGKRSSRVVSFMVDILSGVPSIVAALFIFALMITLMGLGRSAIAAALALVLLMLPTVLRSTEEMLKLVPDSLREASFALGVPKWKTILHVVIPTSFGGIATGVVLGLARVMGETAPLLILIAYARNLNLSPTSDTMGTLPTMINVARDVPDQFPGYERVWGAALTLILLVMGLNLLARGIAKASQLKEK